MRTAIQNLAQIASIVILILQWPTTNLIHATPKQSVDTIPCGSRDWSPFRSAVQLYCSTSNEDTCRLLTDMFSKCYSVVNPAIDWQYLVPYEVAKNSLGHPPPIYHIFGSHPYARPTGIPRNQIAGDYLYISHLGGLQEADLKVHFYRDKGVWFIDSAHICTPGNKLECMAIRGNFSSEQFLQKCTDALSKIDIAQEPVKRWIANLNTAYGKAHKNFVDTLVKQNDKDRNDFFSMWKNGAVELGSSTLDSLSAKIIDLAIKPSDLGHCVIDGIRHLVKFLIEKK